MLNGLITQIKNNEDKIRYIEKEIAYLKVELCISPISIVSNQSVIRHKPIYPSFGIQTIPSGLTTKIITYTADAFLGHTHDEIEQRPYIAYFGNSKTRKYIIENSTAKQRFNFKTLIQKKDGSVYKAVVTAGYIKGILNQFYKVITPIPSYQVITTPVGNPFERRLAGADIEGLEYMGYNPYEVSEMMKLGQYPMSSCDREGIIKNIENYYKESLDKPPFITTTEFLTKNNKSISCYLQVKRLQDGTYQGRYIPLTFL